MQMSTVKCKLCLTPTPIHLIERLINNGKRITVCQYCITDDMQLAERFSKLSGIDYNKLVEKERMI